VTNGGCSSRTDRGGRKKKPDKKQRLVSKDSAKHKYHSEGQNTKLRHFKSGFERSEEGGGKKSSGKERLLGLKGRKGTATPTTRKKKV